MTDSIDTLILIRKSTLAALHVLDGTVWVKSSGELHYQYKEMPNWIEIAADSDLRAAHQAFVAIFEPYFAKLGDVNVTVSYNTGPNSTGLQRAFFDTNDDVRAALNDPDFGGKPASPQPSKRLAHLRKRDEL
jgi:hypothetical protein